MRRYRAVALSLIVLLGLLAGGIGFPAEARLLQDDSGADLGDGITIEPLAESEVVTLPGAPATLRLERLTVQPGEVLPVPASHGVELVVIEAGSLTLTDDLGLAGAYETGMSLLVPAGAPYEIRNDEDDPAAVLIVTVATDEASVHPGARTFLDGPITGYSNPAGLSLSRIRVEPGAETGALVAGGPLGVVVEAGELQFDRSSIGAGSLAGGFATVAPAAETWRLRNDGAEPAIALMVGVLADERAMLGTPEPAPTPTPTATPEPKAGTELYLAGVDEGGFDEWALTGGWSLLDDMLVSDGSSDAAIIAPYQPGEIRDYAFEADIRVMRARAGDGDAGFGLFARGDGEIAYRAEISGLDAGVGEQEARLTVDGETLASAGIAVDDDWHRYRLEIQGNYIRLLIDRVLVLETQDNLLIEGGQIGLWSDGVQVNVRQARVIKLGRLKPGEAPSNRGVVTPTPDAPAVTTGPASVEIHRLLCAPGYSGSNFYGDCHDRGEAGVSFTLIGPDGFTTSDETALPASPGPGVVIFDNIPEGGYVVEEDDAPAAERVFIFCSPDQGATTLAEYLGPPTNGIAVDLPPSPRVVCDWYVVP